MQNIKNIIAAAVVAAIIVFGFSSFMDLTIEIYHFLDNYIWAFFAGIIAFFIALWLVTLMFYITVITLTLVLVILAWIIQAFSPRR